MTTTTATLVIFDDEIVICEDDHGTIGQPIAQRPAGSQTDAVAWAESLGYRTVGAWTRPTGEPGHQFVTVTR